MLNRAGVRHIAQRAQRASLRNVEDLVAVTSDITSFANHDLDIPWRHLEAPQAYPGYEESVAHKESWHWKLHDLTNSSCYGTPYYFSAPLEK